MKKVTSSVHITSKSDLTGCYCSFGQKGMNAPVTFKAAGFTKEWNQARIHLCKLQVMRLCLNHSGSDQSASYEELRGWFRCDDQGVDDREKWLLIWKQQWQLLKRLAYMLLVISYIKTWDYLLFIIKEQHWRLFSIEKILFSWLASARIIWFVNMIEVSL